MWISGGEHDMAGNVVHLMLARIEGAPKGIKGISLFIVPKKLVNAQGELSGERNDVALAGLNHKLGWRGTTNTLLNFGEGRYPVRGQAGAIGYLVKPFQKSDLIPAIEVAIGRFRELAHLSGEVDALGEQLEARKTIDRAKGILIDDCGLKESDAFAFIQRTAMSQRSRMRDVADQVIAGTLRP